MTIPAIHSGNQMLQLSQQMAEQSATMLNQQSLPARDDVSFNQVDTTPEAQPALESQPQPPMDPTQPLMQLNQAQSYSRVGASVVQRNQDMLGTMLDLHV